jgi:DNA-binding CsgD family transcriptional regulator
MELLVAGGTSKTIGTRLGVSPRTVDTHIRTILVKLRARNRTHAVTLWLTEWRDR